MAEVFNYETATKAECLEKADKLLRTGLRAEEAGKDRQVDMALNIACKAENAAFDGRE